MLAAGGAGALLRGGDRHGAGVVEQRGLHPEEHHREEGGQQDHELDGRRAAFVPPPRGYLMLPAWLVTYAFTAATTIADDGDDGDRPEHVLGGHRAALVAARERDRRVARS